MSNITYRNPKKSDALRISVLLKTVYIQTYAKEGVTSELANFLTDRFSVERIVEGINDGTKSFIVAYNNENPIGVAVIHFDHICPINNIPVPDLDKLYILQSFYGKGIGHYLLKKVEEEVFQKNYHQVNLEVYVGNERAINFYKKHGYQSIGTVDFIMEENVYDNFVMTKHLQN